MRGEVQRIRESRSGHLYFELVEKGRGDQIVGKLESVLWRSDYQRVRKQLEEFEQPLAEGREIRCRGNLDFYPPFGRLQWVVRELDPAFTVGLLAERRRRTLRDLAAAGLLDRNRALSLPELPLRVALVTSEGSAAYHDFVTTLQESGYGFRVLVLHAAVQGQQAERELVSALRALPGLGVDCAALIRGGGSRADLAVFDSRAVAEAVAVAPVPVLTGLGHEIDETVADHAAHSAHKTPTKVAELLVERLAGADRRLAAVRTGLRRAARQPLREAAAAVQRAERSTRLIRFRLSGFEERLEGLARALRRESRRRVEQGRAGIEGVTARLVLASPRRLKSRSREPRRLVERIAAGARSSLRQRAAELEGRARLCAQLSPRRTLERGFTITRDSRGRTVRDPGQVKAGSKLVTEWAQGSLASRVEGS